MPAQQATACVKANRSNASPTVTVWAPTSSARLIHS